jgi:hypothetical protein
LKVGRLEEPMGAKKVVPWAALMVDESADLSVAVKVD